MGKRFTLDWRGKQVRGLVEQAVIHGLNEFGLQHETASKAPLKAGRGVLTGTYRRSLHAARPGYNFGGDDVQPSSNSPERSGTGGQAEKQGHFVQIVMGSGLKYACFVEDRYRTIREGHAKVLPKLPSILEKHANKVGLSGH